MSRPQASLELPAQRAIVGPFQRSRPGPWRDPLRRRLLALADACAALAVSLSLVGLAGGETAAWSLVALPIWLLLAKLHGLYDRDHRALRHLTVDELPALVLWGLTAAAATALVLVPTPPGTLSVVQAAAAWGVGSAAGLLFRSLTRCLWRRVTRPERTLILGSGPLAEATRRKLQLFPDIHCLVVGERRDSSVLELRSGPGWLEGIDRLILASPSVDEALLAELVAVCRREGIKLSLVPPVRGMFGTAVQLNHVADLPVLEYNTWDVSRSTLYLKRVLDLAVSVPLALLLSPLFLLLALAVRLDSPGPALFVQWRGGLNGRPFRMLKFRTMVANAEERLAEVVDLERLEKPMFKLAADPRVTRLGRFLRRTSLDELPQLLNVVKGDMSLVGPRPEQIELVERYRPEHMFRLAVRPGLTGPMQVYGRGELTFDERLAVEREYIENLSLSRDLRILGMTLAAVVGGRGAF